MESLMGIFLVFTFLSFVVWIFQCFKRKKLSSGVFAGRGVILCFVATCVFASIVGSNKAEEVPEYMKVNPQVSKESSTESGADNKNILVSNILEATKGTNVFDNEDAFSQITTGSNIKEKIFQANTDPGLGLPMSMLFVGEPNAIKAITLIIRIPGVSEINSYGDSFSETEYLKIIDGVAHNLSPNWDANERKPWIEYILTTEDGGGFKGGLCFTTSSQIKENGVIHIIRISKKKGLVTSSYDGSIEWNTVDGM